MLSNDSGSMLMFGIQVELISSITDFTHLMVFQLLYFKLQSLVKFSFMSFDDKMLRLPSFISFDDKNVAAAFVSYASSSVTTVAFFLSSVKYFLY